ncbi:MAG TPA: helix-turn-helix domain-containing protein [Planctomycetota bacterium]|jgi:putative transcriptional regulator
MKAEAFKELCDSIKYAGKVLRGEAKPSRVFTADSIFIRSARSKLKLSQTEFAALLGLPVSTLRNWEQGRTTPDGPARALLIVAAAQPEAVYQALHQTRKVRNRKRRLAS